MNFAEAQADHIAKAMDRTGIKAAAHKSVDRSLANQVRTLQLRKQELYLLGKAEAAECVETALAALEDAREEM